jgi:hypothetical protein
MTHVDTRADVYGATAVLRWAATGSRYEHTLAEVAHIGMARNPDDRYDDMSTWNGAVRAALTGHASAVGVGRPPIDDAAPIWARPALALVSGLSIGFIIAAALWFDGYQTTMLSGTADYLRSPSETIATPPATNPSLPPGGEATGTGSSDSSSPEGATESPSGTGGVTGPPPTSVPPSTGTAPASPTAPAPTTPTSQ